MSAGRPRAAGAGVPVAATVRDAAERITLVLSARPHATWAGAPDGCGTAGTRVQCVVRHAADGRTLRFTLRSGAPSVRVTGRATTATGPSAQAAVSVRRTGPAARSAWPGDGPPRRGAPDQRSPRTGAQPRLGTQPGHGAHDHGPRPRPGAAGPLPVTPPNVSAPVTLGHIPHLPTGMDVRPPRPARPPRPRLPVVAAPPRAARPPVVAAPRVRAAAPARRVADREPLRAAPPRPPHGLAGGITYVTVLAGVATGLWLLRRRRRGRA